MGNLGFRGLSSLLYTLRRPTQVVRGGRLRGLNWESEPDHALQLRHIYTHRLEAAGSSPVLDRTPLVFNDDVAISIARPRERDDFFYRNAMGDEIIYVTEGGGVLESQFGELPFRTGDYIVIPRGIIHRYRLDDSSQIFLILESAGYVRTPDRYRNPHGQLLEHSPYCERDIRRPESLPVHDETGEVRLIVKKLNALHEVILDHHPFDVVGWDGYYYPWALNIEDFEPIVGRIHQPPPVHQTIAGDGFVVCSFVPRLFDFHPEAIPAPYNHSNVMSDEVLYYANSEFMSRKGIEYGSLTLHPDGMPHGPHPGKTEASIGKKETKELAVMVDTFRPLRVAKAALAAEDQGYARSWLEEDHD
ncbi:MAG: homogentisate 1,2-dioxygenase [Candidatus Eisenbacteria bacterium]|nr:homogentisate 1,2-dioxygenase [Candidatus Eisenbacteria bacterium]